MVFFKHMNVHYALLISSLKCEIIKRKNIWLKGEYSIYKNLPLIN